MNQRREQEDSMEINQFPLPSKDSIFCFIKSASGCIESQAIGSCLDHLSLSRFMIYCAFNNKEVPPMAALRFADVQSRPTEFLDFTSGTLDEFQHLIPPFEAAFHAHMAAWRLDGKPRTARQFSVYKTCPLPTPEDRLFFLLTYLKTYSFQVVQGRLFGMGQSKAHQWSDVLLPALLAALRTLGDAPARSLIALAQRLGV